MEKHALFKIKMSQSYIMQKQWNRIADNIEIQTKPKFENKLVMKQYNIHLT